jgi:hypothetical protein
MAVDTMDTCPLVSPPFCPIYISRLALSHYRAKGSSSSKESLWLRPLLTPSWRYTPRLQRPHPCFRARLESRFGGLYDEGTYQGLHMIAIGFEND